MSHRRCIEESRKSHRRVTEKSPTNSSLDLQSSSFLPYPVHLIPAMSRPPNPSSSFPFPCIASPSSSLPYDQAHPCHLSSSSLPFPVHPVLAAHLCHVHSFTDISQLTKIPKPSPTRHQLGSASKLTKMCCFSKHVLIESPKSHTQESLKSHREVTDKSPKSHRRVTE